MLVQIVVGQTYYVDPLYTEAITGKTHPVTGEELIFGVNAFDVLSDADAVLQAGDSLYVNGLASDSITVTKTVSLYLTDSAAPLLKIGQTALFASYSGDIVTVISGSTFGSENGWLVARRGTIDGDVSILIENSVLGNGWPTARSTPQFRLAESSTFRDGTISVTIRDSVIKEDISLLDDSVVGSKIRPATVILTLERVSVPDDKWFWLTNTSTERDCYADVVFNITDSTLGNNGTTALSVAYDRSGTDTFNGSVTYNIDDVYFSGILYPVTTWAQGYPYIGHTGVYTANITGGSNRIEAVCGFDVVNIAAGATLFTDDFSGNKTVNVAGELRASSIASGTTVSLLSGGTITGPVDLTGVTFATVESGSVVNFDIVDARPSDTMSVRKLSALNNIPEFELVVSPLLEHGTYMLATDAKGFDKTITVRNGEDGSVLGTIALDQTVEILGRSYELKIASRDYLQLTITGDDGGSVKGHKVQPGRKLYLSRGQTAEDTTVLRGGEFRVIGTGVATGTTVDFGGSMIVSGGGTAEGITVNSLGRLSIYSNGIATGIVENGGCVDIVGENETVSFVPNSFYGIILSNGCSATIHSGTTAYETGIGWYGYMTVFSGGIAYDTKVGAYGHFNVFNGGTADGLTIDSQGATSVGGTLNNAVVNAGGLLYVSSGGKTDNVAMNSGGQLNISGGKTDNVAVNGGGEFIVRGGVVDHTTVNASGSMVLDWSTASANNTVVNSGGFLDLRGGETALGIKLYGSANIYGKAYEVELNRDGLLTVFDGGTATIVFNPWWTDQSNITSYSGATVKYLDRDAGVYYGERLVGIISKADVMDSLVVEQSRTAIVYDDGIVNGATVSSGGSMIVSRGGTANRASVSSGGKLYVSRGGTANATEVFSGGSVQVLSSGIANGATVNSGGRMNVSGGTVNDATVNSGGSFLVSKGATATGAAVNGAAVNDGGVMEVFSGGKLTGKMTFGSGALVSMNEGAILNFDLTRTEAGAAALVNGLSSVQGAPKYTLTVGGTEADGMYALADGAAEFAGTITVVNTKGKALGAFAVGETVEVGDVSYTLNLTESVLSVAVAVPVPPVPGDLVGTPDGVSWTATGADAYAVEYSTDDFKHVVSVVTTGTSVDTPELPAGTYQWRVKADDCEWAVGEPIASENDPAAAKAVRSDGDGGDDLFFASPVGVWENIYYAQHVGSVNDWTGTNELVSANGKGRIQNLFFGSADPNVLCLSDGANGDAIFVDDVYTGLPDGIAEQTARLFKIREIRAGAGDDIVDMTSQQFEYVGDGLTIRGGDGNDTIWANKGDNWLVGDAGNDRIVGASGNDVIAGGIGNDRMHGGGGDDVFAFCGDWGADEVRQLGTGTVTLWFASGDIGNWDAAALTYTDGENSVVVKGVKADKVTLKFGDDGSARFTALSEAGAFDAFTSRRVFEDSGAGMLSVGDS